MQTVILKQKLLSRTAYSAAILMVLMGLVGAFWGLFRSMEGSLTGVPAAGGVTLLAVAVLGTGLRLSSTRLFLLFAAACWLVTRGATVLLFPNYVLPGDERYFHDFVATLVTALPHGSISTLSGIYDFSVWLSRAFPFYLPLAALFGPHDIEAARWLNVLLGVGQMICLFFIARRLIGARGARVTCLLLLVFPYHCINVLSYDPQIAGTFFLLLAVWLFLCLRSASVRSIPSLIGLCAGLAIALLLAGIQRGGIDLLLIAAMLLVSMDRRRHRNALACLAALVLLWLPLRLSFDHWIASQDSHSLRTHALGFMTRGWNLDTSGEYLPLYEALDIAAAKTEKQRTLEAVLVTEFAREPIRSLLVLTPVKTAKFFAIGYASTAEQGLAAGGYPSAVSIFQLLRSFYAPLILGFCLLGLIRCWPSSQLQRRLLLPVLLVVLSAAAIVLVWETSPRYSHPIHFALLILAAAGLARLPSAAVLKLRPRFVLDFAASGGAIMSGWLIVSLCIVSVARSSPSYQFMDPRHISAQIGKTPIAVQPLHAFSSSWEGAISVPAGIALPVTADISFPAPPVAAWDHLSVSVWLPADSAGYRISCGNGETSIDIPAAASGRIARIKLPRSGSNSAILTLSITSADGQFRTALKTTSTLRVGIGYALAN